MFPTSPITIASRARQSGWVRQREYGRRLLFGICLASLSLSAFSQEKDTPESLNAIYQSGIAAFNSGDFATASANLTKLLDQVPEGQLEPIYYTLGAAYFNAKNYPKGIEIFQLYLTKFPKSFRLADVTFALAQSYLATGNVSLATTLAKNLEANPLYREQALIFRATAAKSTNNLDDAISALETLVGENIKTKLSARGALMLASLYVEKEQNDKAAALFINLERNIMLVENVVGLNSLAVELGDLLLAKEDYRSALACYRAIRLKDEVIRLQKERVVEMEAQIETNLAGVRANPADAARLLSLNQPIRTEIESAKKLLAEFEKLPQILASVYMRMARCYYEDQRKWEAIVVYEELLNQIEDASERENARYALAVTYAEVNQPKIAAAKCDEYLKEFPAGPNVATVSYLRGSMALQSENFSEAESWFGSILEKQPKSEMREQIRLLLGNAKFSQGQYEEAATQYRKYLEEFPQSGSAEEAEYRIALSQLFGGKYDEAVSALNSYLQKHQQGSFVADARYRLLVCQYAVQQYDPVIAGCLAWRKDFPENDQTGEVMSLQADALAAQEKLDEAIPIYIAASKLATTDEVQNYALFEASKHLQKKGQWEQVATLFEDFVKEKSTHPTAVAALFWIGKARAKLGKVDEAKKFLATTIQKYLDDPSSEPVESMITQLVQLCAKKQRPTAAATDPAPSPAPAIDPAVELDQLLGTAASTPTAKARVLFAKSELAGLLKNPTGQNQFLQQIIDTTKPEELSPVLLARLGDFALGQKNTDKATVLYTELKDFHPKSDVIDFAYAGLGEIAFEKGDFAGSAKFFTYGTDKIAASQKLKEITLGKARALFALGRFPEAKPLFEQVASVREWRGVSTAESVYWLGQIEWKQGRFAEANAYFQRVFVAYQKFTPWAAKAYISSGDCFEKIGKISEARKTYQEMLRQEKFAALPEAATARKRLEEIGQG